MAELRSVDPRTLKPNPNNPRKTPAPQAMDDQLLASITAIGIIQPPVVREVDGDLVIKAGERRVKAANRRGTFCFYDVEINAAHNRRRLELDLRRALIGDVAVAS